MGSLDKNGERHASIFSFFGAIIFGVFVIKLTFVQFNLGAAELAGLRGFGTKKRNYCRSSGCGKEGIQIFLLSSPYEFPRSPVIILFGGRTARR
jgi:hypothetical protein